MLEASQYKSNCFLTLTYDEKSLPRTPNGMPTLQKEDATKFLKRLRKSIEPIKIRYFLVGEYGDKTERPHYHAAVFNFPPCSKGRTNLVSEVCCFNCELVRKAWGHGSIESRALEIGGARYVGGYITKKMTRNDDIRLAGRDPEYSTMSRNGGLGVSALHDVADVLLRYDLHELNADVPNHLQGAKRERRMLGAFLRRKLRTLVGKEAKAPLETLQAAKEALQDLYAAAEAAPRPIRTLVLRNGIEERNSRPGGLAGSIKQAKRTI